MLSGKCLSLLLVLGFIVLESPVLSQPPPMAPDMHEFVVPDCDGGCYTINPNTWKSCTTEISAYGTAIEYAECSEAPCGYDSLEDTYACSPSDPDYTYDKVNEGDWSTLRVVFELAYSGGAGARCLEWRANYCYIAYPCRCAMVGGIVRCVKFVSEPAYDKSLGFAYMIHDSDGPCTGP